MTNANDIRKAIKASLPKETFADGKAPVPKDVYIPSSHAKALRLECSLVIGARGVGKTFWSNALNSPKIRTRLTKALPDLSQVDVCTGYGTNPAIDSYPDMDSIKKLLSDHDITPYNLWRAVLSRRYARNSSIKIPSKSWLETVNWVTENPEMFSRLQEEINTEYAESGKHLLFVFDALDRTSEDWKSMDVIVRDLLKIALSLKSFTNIHSKIFLREDQYRARPVTNFPDSSKLLAGRAELSWERHDLHGLLWQHFCNAPENKGEALQALLKSVKGAAFNPLRDGIQEINSKVKSDEDLQKKLFEKIAGEWMGKDRRRGIPYSWSVGHLADSHGRTTPRSFLTAILAAAEDSDEKYPGHDRALHYESIKRGVQKASDIRVKELSEDYPWVVSVMNPLKRLVVPCSFNLFEERWEERENDLKKEINKPGRLPPEHFDEGWKGILEDLVSLGILEKMSDGRINMPDLYRVGFGLGRRGGVKPSAKSNSI